MRITRTAAVAIALAAIFLNPGSATSSAASGPLARAPATYKQLAAKWWKWAASTPFSEDGPFGERGTDCGQNQPNGNTWFLAGSFGDPADRSCDIPAGTRLFFPVVTVECSSLEPAPFFGGTVAERRACVEQELFAFVPLFAELDGEAVVPDLNAYTVVSPNFPLVAVADNPAIIPEGRGFAREQGHLAAAGATQPRRAHPPLRGSIHRPGLRGIHARSHLPPHGGIAARRDHGWTEPLLRTKAHEPSA